MNQKSSCYLGLFGEDAIAVPQCLGNRAKTFIANRASMQGSSKECRTTNN